MTVSIPPPIFSFEFVFGIENEITQSFDKKKERRMDYDRLVSLRDHHPAWRLLAADSAPFVVGFLHHCFIHPNVRTLSEPDLITHLEDYVYKLGMREGDAFIPRQPRAYLTDWADDAHGWLRRYYPSDSDEPHYDLTPAAEQAIHWLKGLEQRQFVGAESRLKLVFDLLRQIAEGAETDPDVRIQELERRRAAIDAEIDGIRAGNVPLMDGTQMRERFMQAADTARALLSDFRQVEQNFRELDRQIRERIAMREGSKGEVLDDVFSEHTDISKSDQGRSFRAFWDFLMSPARQEELTRLLGHIMALEPVAGLNPDPRIRRIHCDWMEAGEVTQRTVARLSEQLRRYLDDKALHENRRITTLIEEIQKHALALRDAPLKDFFMDMDELAPEVQLPMDRPLFTPPVKPHITQQKIGEADADVPTEALYEQFFVDKDRLRGRIQKALQARAQVGLEDLLREEPLEQGLAELVAWLSLATGGGSSGDPWCGVIDDERSQTVTWMDADGTARCATLPAVVFAPLSRQGAEGA